MKLIYSLTKLFVFVLGLVTAVAGLAQPAAVALPVTALNEKTGISADQDKAKIQVFVGKTEQKVTSIVSADTPAKIVFLVDYSGSMKDMFSKPEKLRLALIKFFETANPANEYALIAFNQDAALIKDWTTKPQDVIDGLDSLTAQKPQGRTALYNALTKGMHYLNTRATGKKALILFTDGDHHQNSQSSQQEIVAKSNELQIPIYCAVLDDSVDSSSGIFTGSHSVREGGLSWLGKETGGETTFRRKPDDLDKAFTKIGNLIRQQFIIKFTPTIGKDDGRVNIKIKFFTSANQAKEIDHLKILHPQYYVAKK